MSYDDGRIACTDDTLVIRNYYFPAGTKRIPYRSIKQVRRRPKTGLLGKIWGSSDFVHWYNLDPGRPKKDTELIIDRDGRFTKPVITPDRVDEVAGELAAHGVTVTYG